MVYLFLSNPTENLFVKFGTIHATHLISYPLIKNRQSSETALFTDFYSYQVLVKEWLLYELLMMKINFLLLESFEKPVEHA